MPITRSFLLLESWLTLHSKVFFVALSRSVIEAALSSLIRSSLPESHSQLPVRVFIFRSCTCGVLFRAALLESYSEPSSPPPICPPPTPVQSLIRSCTLSVIVCSDFLVRVLFRAPGRSSLSWSLIRKLPVWILDLSSLALSLDLSHSL